MKKTKTRHFPVSVIVPMRNSETTVIKTLRSILQQKYPIVEIFVIDNASTDISVRLVKKLAKTEKRVPIKLILQKINQGVGTSYNVGVAKAKSDYVIFMHSDSVLPSDNEFVELTEPFHQDPQVVATCALATLPEELWLQYPFWEKCLLVQSVGKRTGGLNAKCDCHRKQVFLSIGGFDEVNYAREGNIGGEDGDLAMRLQKLGKTVVSAATVIHLHDLRSDYSLGDWVRNKKLLARSYGRYLRYHYDDFRLGTGILLIKPVLAIVSVVTPYPWNVLMLFIAAIASLHKMYLNSFSQRDWRIVILPFVSVFLIFYETFWIVESFLYLHKKNV